MRRVLDGASGGAVAVLAGAGYGKSTLLAQAAGHASMPVAWCACDEGVASPELLIAHVAAAFGERLPGFGAGLAHLLDGPDDIAALTNEVVDTLPDEMLLVLDDVHALPAAAAAVLGPLVERMPANVRLALAGRAPLPFGQRRFRGRRLTLLGEGDLALDASEVHALLGRLGVALDAVDTRQLADESEGWITGVILAAQARSRPIDRRPPGGSAFSGYLADELLSRQPEEVQRFVLATAVVDRFCPALAAALTGHGSPGEAIQGLVDGHLFCIRLGGGEDEPWFRYHHLFQAFLRGRLAERHPRLTAELHERAATWFLTAGEPEEAVPHLVAARHWGRAADVLEPLAEEIVRSPRRSQLRAWFRTIPRATWERRPALALAETSLLALDGRYADAFSAMARTVDLLLARGDPDAAALVLCRLIRARGAGGLGLLHGVDAVASIVSRIGPGARMLPLAQIMLAGGYGWLCRFDEAERALETALELPGARGSAAARLYAAVIRAHLIDRIRGRAGDVPALLGAAIEELLRRPDEDVLDFVIHASAYRAFALSYLGRHEEALEEAERQRAIAERTGEVPAAEQARRWLAFTAMAELERWDELARELALDGAAGGPFEASAIGYYRHAFRAQYHASRHDLAALTAEIATCRELMHAHLGGADFTALTDLARASMLAGDTSGARRLAQEALELATALGAVWGRARAAVLVAAGDPGPAGDAALRQALELTEAFGLDDLWTWKERHLAADLLARALRTGIGDPATAERLATACGGEVLDRLLSRREPAVRGAARRARLRVAAGAPPVLHIRAFGPFSVFRGAQLVPRAAFGRERARMLLAALAVAGRPVPREQVMEWFWPELPSQRAARALHTTLHSLRRAIEPERAGAPKQSRVMLGPETCALVLDDADSFDVGDFLALTASSADRGEPARLARLMAAEETAAGDLLPEWPYAEWAEDLRRRVDDRRRVLLYEHAEALASAGRPAEAAERYRRLVAVEPEREEWHRGLMSVLADAGEPALALRQYHACRAVLRRRLAIEPSGQTRALYEEILARC